MGVSRLLREPYVRWARGAREEVYAAVREADDSYVFSKSVHGRNLSDAERKWVFLANGEGNEWHDVGCITSARRVKAYGCHIAKGSLVVHDGVFGHDRLIRFLASPEEAYKSATREAHPKLQPVNSFIAELKHFLRCHVGVRTEYLVIYAAWIAFKSSLRDGEIGETIGLLESFCFQTKASFKVKDRYGAG